MKYLKASLLEKDFLENYFCSFENGLLGCPKIMVLSKALKAKLSSIPSGVASLSMPGLENGAKNHRRHRAFIRPPAVVMLLRARGPLKAPFEIDDRCARV